MRIHSVVDQWNIDLSTFIQEEYTPTNEEPYEQPADWNDAPLIQRPRRPNEEPENTDVLRVSHNNAFLMEDEYDAIGRNVAAKLRNMRLDQRIIAEKLLNDILFEAQLGNLHRDSSIHVWKKENARSDECVANKCDSQYLLVNREWTSNLSLELPGIAKKRINARSIKLSV